MQTPKKHSDIIKAWADGHEIERFSIEQNKWVDEPFPMFIDNLSYRVKQINVIKRQIYMDSLGDIICRPCLNPANCNIEFSFNAAGLLESVKRI